MGGRRERWLQMSLVIASVLATVGAVGWMLPQLWRGQSAADTASLVGMVLTVAGLAVAVASLRSAKAALGQATDAAAQARSAADTLARQVERRETAQWRCLVGGDRQRINLHYTVHPQHHPGSQAPAPDGQLFDDGAAEMPDITAYYRATTPRRLVVTGAPGAGKTVMALELLLGLLEQRTMDEPVPIRVSLADWNPSTTPLEELLTEHLMHAFDWPRDRARQLVHHNLLLPVLDGLDEMDPGLRDLDGELLRDAEGGPRPDPEAPRARAALEALNAYSRGRVAGPLVLTCRTTHYQVLASDDQLRDAARISIRPVRAGDALAYLTNRFGGALRWHPLLDHLRAHPRGVLARIMSTPWRLSLAATVFRRAGDPADLLAHSTVEGLDGYLLDHLIPATTVLHVPRRGYSAAQVHSWLSVLARHLEWPQGSAGQTETGVLTDIHLHRLWVMAGRARVRAWDAVLTGLVIAVSLPLTVSALPESGFLKEPAFFAVWVGFFACFGAVMAARSHNVPKRLQWRVLRSSTGRSRIVRSYHVWMAGGVVFLPMLMISWLPGVGEVFSVSLIVIGMLYGAAFALVYGLTALQQEPSGLLSTPADTVSVKGLSGAVLGVIGGLSVFLFLYGFLYLFGFTVLALELALVVGVGLTLVFGVAVGAGAARRYLVFLAFMHPKLPFRLNVFLAYAHEAGLLRLSGNAYQFRHRELQEWLATHPA